MQTLTSPIASIGWIRIEFFNTQTARIRVNKSGTFEPTQSDILIRPDYQAIDFEQKELSPNALLVATNSLRIEIDTTSGALSFRDTKGQTLLKTNSSTPYSFEPTQVYRYLMDEESLILKETVDGERAEVKVKETVFDRDAWKARIHFDWTEQEALYGLGSHEEDYLNLRGKMQYVYQHNLKACVPVLVSTAGYGLLFHSECAMEFHDDSAGSFMELDTVDEIDFFFFLGPQPDQVIAQYRELTGRVPMQPKWLFGYCQSKERYKSQEEIVAIAREFRERQIPIDLIVQDWHYWPDGWGGKHFDATRYPDPSKLTEDIHALDIKVMISIWPNMMDSKNRPEMIAAGGMLNDHTIYDAFDEKARDLYWKQCSDGIFQHGFDAWWCDSTEPYIDDWGGENKRSSSDRAKGNIEEFKRHIDAARINAYSLYHSKGIYENQLREEPRKRVVNLTRSAYAGQQRYGTITWPGDPSANWETLAQNIPALLNFSASGCPYVTMDIGAFFVGTKEQWFWSGDYENGVEDLGYRELYTRWLQFGAFTPVFRSHGTDTPREPWRFGEPGTPFYDSILKFIKLRYRLLPYIYSLAGWTTQKHYTIMRPLAFDFPGDKRTHDCKDQFMFGPALMVCPITKPMYYEANSRVLTDTDKTRSVYLPKGADWFNFWTGDRYSGGQTITVAATIDTMPIFAKAGSILPIGPDLQHTGEKPSAKLIALVYPGADATFELYEDEGEGNGYQAGDFATTELKWNEASQTFQVSKTEGGYPGKLTTTPVQYASGTNGYNALSLP